MRDHEGASAETWLATLRAAAVLIAVFTLTTLAYTIACAGIAAVVRRTPAEHLVLDADRAAAWSGPRWFHGRPSGAAAGVSGGSNLGPTNPALAATVAERVAAVLAENPTHVGPIPVDLVTASGSGLDPHISPPAALLQVARVAAANGLPATDVRRLVEQSIEPRSLGVFGQPRVNVAALNIALESLAVGRSRTTGGGPP